MKKLEFSVKLICNELYREKRDTNKLELNWTFDKFNASLLNESILSFQKYLFIQHSSFWLNY